VIRHVFRIDAPLELVRDVFCDSDAWPQWMPHVEACRTVQEGRDHRLVELTLTVFGRSFTQTRELRRVGNVLKQRQASGWFKRWETEWSFLEPPDRSGTTVAMWVDWDLGMRRLAIPSWVMQKMSLRLLDETKERARTRIRERLREPRPAVEEESLLRVYETPDGLEVRLAGRTYVLKAAECSVPR
jgi:ribosome-associated toxin RatA of RatAB toxin-antitoxin module